MAFISSAAFFIFSSRVPFGASVLNRLHSLTAASLRRHLPWSTEEQDVAVRVRNLEPAKTVVGILEGRAECCSTIGNSMFGKSAGKFRGELIRVGCIDEGIPPHEGMALWVRQRRQVFMGLDEDLRSVAADDGEKGGSIRLLESCLKAQLVAVKSDSLIDVADDEER
jgi:hypothetical protein